MKLIDIIKYVIYGVMINLLISVFWFIMIYMNPATYYAREGYSSGLIALVLAIAVWSMLIISQFKKQNKEALIGYLGNAGIILIILSIATLTDCKYIN